MAILKRNKSSTNGYVLGIVFHSVMGVCKKTTNGTIKPTVG
jgi:hypothetical protein